MPSPTTLSSIIISKNLLLNPTIYRAIPGLCVGLDQSEERLHGARHDEIRQGEGPVDEAA
jgi:hypothetical protein